jgi:hypothetical protein
VLPFAGHGAGHARRWGELAMVTLAVGDAFPAGSLQDIDGQTVDFPAIFSAAPATVVFFYRGRW